jgi:hypothetical protein
MILQSNIVLKFLTSDNIYGFDMDLFSGPVPSPMIGLSRILEYEESFGYPAGQTLFWAADADLVSVERQLASIAKRRFSQLAQRVFGGCNVQSQHCRTRLCLNVLYTLPGN